MLHIHDYHNYNDFIAQELVIFTPKLMVWVVHVNLYSDRYGKNVLVIQPVNYYFGYDEKGWEGLTNFLLRKGEGGIFRERGELHVIEDLW